MDRTREVLQFNYHKSISDKACEIHYRTASRLKEIERNHKAAIHRLRQAFRTQLDSAVRKVATEHMVMFRKQILKGGFLARSLSMWPTRVIFWIFSLH